MPPGVIFFIPARLEPCEPKHPKISSLQFADLFDDWDAGVKAIAAAMDIRERFAASTPAQSSTQPSARIQFQVSDEAMIILDELQTKLEATSKVEVIRRALGIIQFVTEQQREGNEILMKEAGGKIFKILA
jgi:hypothetical protein